MNIDFILDVSCLWSYIAWKQLRDALRDCAVQSEIMPYFVSSGSFLAGFSLTPAEKNRMLEERTRPLLEQNGLSVNFENLPDLAADLSLTNQLVRIAFAEKKYDVLDEIFASFFSFGKDITDPAVLAAIAEKNDIRRQTFISLPLRPPLPVSAPEGLRAVPCFIINRRIILFGAQSVPCLKNILHLSNRITKENPF